MCDEHSKTSDPAVGSTRLLAAVELLKENREACAACFRVMAQTHDPTIMHRLNAELSRAGVKQGFGVRTQDFISANVRGQAGRGKSVQHATEPHMLCCICDPRSIVCLTAQGRDQIRNLGVIGGGVGWRAAKQRRNGALVVVHLRPRHIYHQPTGHGDAQRTFGQARWPLEISLVFPQVRSECYSRKSADIINQQCNQFSPVHAYFLKCERAVQR